MNDGTIIIGTKVDTSGVKEGIEDIKEEVTKADFVDELEKKTGGIKGIFSSIASKIASAFKTIGGAIKIILAGLLKFIGYFLVLAPLVILIGGLFYIIIKALEKVGDEHSEIAQKVQYIAFVINQALAPAIEGVANFIAKVLNFILDGIIKIIAYIGYIVKFLTGFNIFKSRI